MKQVTIVSGKGGTGKTSLVAAWASMLSSTVFTDCDVDAANLHLLLHPQVEEKHLFPGSATARIDAGRCNLCGTCYELCRFNAIGKGKKSFRVNDIRCEGCKLCMHACPKGAIDLMPSLGSWWYVSSTSFGPLIHARLGIGEDLSGKLVARLREKARERAKAINADLILTDGPPGTGCPVIAAINGADLAVIVTEPTLSGMADLKRIYQLVKHFGIPAKVVINKWDINPAMTREMGNYCHDGHGEVAGIIPYSSVFLEAVNRNITVPQYAPRHQISHILRNVLHRIRHGGAL